MFSSRDRFAILECGVDRWNDYRHQHPETLVLNFVVMPGAQLPKVDFHQTILMESDLSRANLVGAILRGSILRKTDLRQADLREAVLSGADLCRANLAGADLREANLTAAFLRRTNLRGADLSTSVGLTENQISQAIGDDATRLPCGLGRPASWSA